MIDSIYLENYRGFQKHTIHFKDENIIVGKNNAGKSTLVEALRIVSAINRKYKNTRYRKKPSWVAKPSQKGITPSINFTDINEDTLFYNYGSPPAYIEVSFNTGSRFEITIGKESNIYCQIFDENNQFIRTKNSAQKLDIPSVRILPQIQPLQESEDILNEDYVKNHLFSSRSSLHFRNQLHYFNEYFDEFKKIAEKTWPGLRINELIVNKNLIGKGHIDLLVYDNEFASEIGWMGDGLQMWLQTIWFLALAKNKETVILDEPDVYMHPDLQRRLVRFISNRHKQIVITTHSVEIISEVKTENILVLNKSRKKSNFTTSLPAVQNVMDSIGTAHNLQLARLWSAKKLVLVEGADIQILKQFQNIIYPESLDPLDAIPNMSIGGWGGWNYAIGSSMLLKNSVGEKIQVYCLLDSDYHSESEIEKKYKEANQREVSLNIWNKKEIENYLLNPIPISRFIKENKQEKKDIEPNIVVDQLKEITSKVKNETIDQVATAISKENKSFEGGTVTKKARKYVNDRWNNLNDRISIVPGKEVLKLLSDWSLSEYGTNISPVKLASYFRETEIPNELKEVLKSIEKGDDF